MLTVCVGSAAACVKSLLTCSPPSSDLWRLARRPLDVRNPDQEDYNRYAFLDDQTLAEGMREALVGAHPPTQHVAAMVQLPIIL